MMPIHPGSFLDLPPRPLAEADAVVLPLPFEQTVSYGPGTAGGPEAILAASAQVETFDEETLVDFEEFPRVHTAAPLVADCGVEDYLLRVEARARELRGRFLLALGGEHTVTCGLVAGLAERPADLTIVQVDAHADLIDRLEGQRWSHGTAMRRLWERGCRIIQVGVRSLSREEYGLAHSDERITTFYAHELPGKWPDALRVLAALEGDVYLTFDIDALDPAVVPSTGTPQPDGLAWRQAMDLLRAVHCAASCRVVGADLVEFVPSPHPPGCDLAAAKLAVKMLAFWAMGQRA